MTEKLFDKNSFIKEFNATLISCKKSGKGYEVILDKTAFFYEGGGQTSDTGFLNGISVFDVQNNDGEIIHFTKEPLIKGENVKGVINWSKRFDFMQQHSGEHIVSGIAHSLYGCENVGFHLSEDIVTLDFDIPLDREQISKIESLANKAVFENRDIKTYYPDEKTLEALEYRSKKEIENDLRIVEIEGIDKCACCAPHVKKTGEIGNIKLLGTEKIRGGIRIEIKCGARALEDYNQRYNNTSKISSLLCVKAEDTADAVERLMSQITVLKAKLTDTKRSLTALKTETFAPETKISAIFEEDLSVKDLQLYADALHKKADGIRGVFSRTENGYAFAICGNSEELDEFFKGFKERFIIRGGGRNGMVQGTVSATDTEIKEFFK